MDVVPLNPLRDLQEMFSLQGRTAIVTGAGRGIGAGIARVFAQAGAQVVLAARSVDQLGRVQQDIEASGGKSLVVPTDVANEEHLQNLVRRTKETFGGVDVLVNNAGVNRFLIDTDQVRMSGFDQVHNVNLRGPYILCQLSGREMIAQGRGGAIVNILTTAARQGMPTHGPYGAAKAGLMRASEAMAFEWGEHGIRVNCIGPGPIQTDMSRNAWDGPGRLEAIQETIPIRRIGQPEDIAYACLWLASDAGSYVTGQTIWIDGGPGTARPRREKQ